MALTLTVGRRHPLAREILRALGVLAASLLVFPLLGINLIEAIPSVYRGTLANPYALSQTITIAAVLTLAAGAALVPLRANFVNLGGEGQITMGAVAAIAVALGLGGGGSTMSAVLCLVAAAIAGALWGGFAGALHERFGANAVITTLMFNYIAFAIAGYIRSAVWPDDVSPQTEPVPADTALPQFGDLGAAPVAAAVAVAVWLLLIWLLLRTNFGFRLRATGDNASASSRFGYHPARVRLWAVLLGGALAGLGGGLLVLILNRALIASIASNYGYVGIAAALLIGLRPALLPLGAIAFAVMTVGGSTLSAVARVSPDVALVGVSAAVLVLLASRSTKSGGQG